MLHNELYIVLFVMSCCKRSLALRYARSFPTKTFDVEILGDVPRQVPPSEDLDLCILTYKKPPNEDFYDAPSASPGTHMHIFAGKLNQ